MRFQDKKRSDLEKQKRRQMQDLEKENRKDKQQ